MVSFQDFHYIIYIYISNHRFPNKNILNVHNDSSTKGHTRYNITIYNIKRSYGRYISDLCVYHLRCDYKTWYCRINFRSICTTTKLNIGIQYFRKIIPFTVPVAYCTSNGSKTKCTMWYIVLYIELRSHFMYRLCRIELFFTVIEYESETIFPKGKSLYSYCFRVALYTLYKMYVLTQVTDTIKYCSVHYIKKI